MASMLSMKAGERGAALASVAPLEKGQPFCRSVCRLLTTWACLWRVHTQLQHGVSAMFSNFMQEEAAPMPAVESRIVRIGLSNSAAVFRQQLCLEEGSRHLTTLECRTLAVGMRLVHGAAAYCHALALGGMSRQETTFVQLRGLVTAELRRPASSGNGGASSGGGGASSSISGAPILWVARSSHGGGAGTLCLEMGGYASLLAAADRDERVRCGDHLIGLLLEVVGAAGGKDKALALATDLKNSVQNPQPGKVSAALKSALAKLGIATAQRLSAATAPPSTAFATLMLT
ncbi:hypothetical protein ABPG77_001075 [Micractinium sp. CCAP 211/92]